MAWLMNIQFILSKGCDIETASKPGCVPQPKTASQ